MFKLSQAEKFVDTGRWTTTQLDKLLLESSVTVSPEDRIERLSSQFLDVPYKENTLTGGINTTEVLVINLRQVDCFTFLDYIEAMRVSSSYAEFERNLIRVRYKDGIVLFKNRNHFFTDWVENNSSFVSDVTEAIGCGKARKIQKTLNLKENRDRYLQGIKPIKRVINYLPADFVDAQLTAGLKTGDYAGIYSDRPGLDVSHVGIIIKDRNDTFIRHASSVKKRVVDEPLIDYVSSSPGIIILRPVEPKTAV